LVRHAEKADNSPNTNLSEDGMKRAKALARLLSNVKVEVIYTTPFNRTQQTAQFVADHNKLPIQTYKMDQDFPTLTDTLAKKYPGKTILIVGHSNTLPMNIARLTKKEVYIAESEFDNIYMIQVHNQATTSHLLQLKYGD
jgi:2,3-bisphosphoglycerate-dependent phosphoglycerate mutase